ncbi:MAG: sigma-70 family RNA polymerase sigma factor [Pseudomonadota bacterium]
MPAQSQVRPQTATIPINPAPIREPEVTAPHINRADKPRNPWPKPTAATKPKFKKAVSARNFKKQMVASQDALKRFALRLCNRQDMAEDLMQETLMKAWAARQQFKPGSNFLSWAFTILRNTWLNQLRREKKFVAEFDDQAAERILSAPPSQVATFELADLQRAMSELPTDQLEAVMLVGPGDLTYDEAGEILGCAAGTVKSRASRARATLGDIFDDGKLKMDLADTEDATEIAETFVEAIEEIEQGGNIADVMNLEQTS